MNKAIIVVGPAVKGFLNYDLLKFVLVKQGQNMTLILFQVQDPLNYHDDGVQLYMGTNNLESIIVLGGGQLALDSTKKEIQIFEGSKAFGWAKDELVISFLSEKWKDFNIVIIDHKQGIDAEEKEVFFSSEKYSKIVTAGANKILELA